MNYFHMVYEQSSFAAIRVRQQYVPPSGTLIPPNGIRGAHNDKFT
jgi:hypothetical protein